MKQIFAFVAASLMLFSFASCAMKDNYDPEPKPEVKNFDIMVSDITARKASVTIVPADTTITYFYDIFEASEVAGMTDTQVAEFFKNDFDETIAYYNQEYNYEFTYDGFLVKGNDSWVYKKLEPNTEYVIIALELDENIAAKGPSVRKTFKTLEEKEDPVPADMTFQIAIDNITATSATVAVTPSNKEATYFWEIYETSEIEGTDDAAICARIKEGNDATIEFYAYKDLTIGDLLSKGMDAYTYDNLYPNRDYTIVAVAMGTLGTTNGVVAKQSFKTLDIEVIGDVDLGELVGTKFNDFRDFDGSFIVHGEDEDGTKKVSIAISSNDLAGNFTDADLDPFWSYVWTEDQGGYYGETAVKAELVGTADAEAQTATLSGWVVCVDGIKYHFSLAYSFADKKEESLSAPAKKAKRANKDAKNASVKKAANFKKGNLAKKHKFVSEKLYDHYR